ncbi:carboxymuconolactone decarboxylase family protein [Pseudooceanicola sp. 216_PA32_1]|uniref:Carboxymuconolactone decarboxylase family protein n=1 Tax=Pseudooceanicola pacificus TaxID=2676438 RepID=A0A844WCK5_9RHOB|nr:carboxymuconolactone decarboxylase family protein [Pseudooceanicola pacificus]MWB79113.1 carboxymuconolactone decarboxylase family protein [Pseudooceanicola pacificus]
MTHDTNRGYTLAEDVNPGLRDILEGRYGHVLPGMGDTVERYAYGEFYARPGLELRQRYLCTVAALAALGGQTGPQLRINIAAGLRAGLSKTEIAEAIWQMALYGGLPAAINALNAALEVFAEHDLAGKPLPIR